jgi:hypothetical protein
MVVPDWQWVKVDGLNPVHDPAVKNFPFPEWEAQTPTAVIDGAYRQIRETLSAELVAI